MSSMVEDASFLVHKSLRRSVSTRSEQAIMAVCNRVTEVRWACLPDGWFVALVPPELFLFYVCLFGFILMFLSAFVYLRYSRISCLSCPSLCRWMYVRQISCSHHDRQHMQCAQTYFVS